MELGGHISWPSDPGIQRPGDPVDPVTLFYNELQMLTYVIFQAKEFFIIIGKSKSSLHGLTSSDFSPTTDTWQWLFSVSKVLFAFWAFFRKPEKLASRTGSKWWLGDPDVKNNPLTRWPNDRVMVMVITMARWGLKVDTSGVRISKNGKAVDPRTKAVCLLVCLR